MRYSLTAAPKAKVVLYFPIVWMPQWPMWAPLGMFAIATALIHAGYEVVLIDERNHEDPRGALRRHARQALFVGVCGKSGGQCRNMEAAAAHVKEHVPGVPVVAGGWFASLFPDQTITSANIDVVIAGPADFAIVEVADCLLDGRDMEGIESVYFKRADGEVFKNPIGHLPKLDETRPIPWKLMGIKRYLHPHRWINYFTSRGCPGGCTFCSVYCIDPRRWTALSPERVLADLEELYHEVGARAFQITDTDFCANIHRVEQICRGIIERGLEIRFNCLGRHYTVRRMTDEQLCILRRAGCVEIEVGLETGSQEISDRINKQCDVDEFVATVRRFVDHGIRMRVNIMLGFPGETTQHLAETFRRMLELRELGLHAVRFQMFRFTPVPDSPVAKQVWAMKTRGNPGRVPDTYQELLDFQINDEELDMFWLDPAQERRVQWAYRFWAPLLFYKNSVEVGSHRRPWWRPVLRALRPLAAWRLRHGYLGIPFEVWLHRLFGRPLPMGADEAVVDPGDQLPIPEMGEWISNEEPLPHKASALPRAHAQ